MRLEPRLAFHEGETATSYGRRLGLFHNGFGLRRLLSDIGLDLRGFLTGVEDTVFALAAVAGIAPALLMTGVIRFNERFAVFRGQDLSKSFVIAEGRRFCPACLLEDGAAEASWHGYGRVEWRFRPILTCRRHGLALQKQEHEDGSLILDPMYPHDADLARLAEHASKQDATELETFLVGRIAGGGQGAGGWLDGQTPEQAALVCEMLGATLTRGADFSAKAMLGEDWRAAGAVGFEIASKGEAAVRVALDEVIRRAGTNSGKAGPRAIYGRLYEWLAYQTPVVDQGPIRELLREHILDHLAFARGEMLLGREVERRRLHSVHSLSDETGLHRKRLRKILVQFGLTDDESWDSAANRLVFPADAAIALCNNLHGCLTLHDLQAAVGCTRTQAISLYRQRIIPPIVARDARRRIGRLAFARRDVDALLDRLAALPLRGDGVLDAVDLSRASKSTGLSTGELMALILSGSLPACRVEGQVDLARIRLQSENLTGVRVLRGAALGRPRAG